MKTLQKNEIFVHPLKWARGSRVSEKIGKDIREKMENKGLVRV